MLHGLEKGNVRALHRTRVASRRLRELIPVLQLGGKAADGLSGRLKKVTKRLGGVREVDVLLLLVDELQEAGRYDRDALSKVVATLVDDRTAARKNLFAKMPIPEIKRLASKLRKIADQLAKKDARDRRLSARGWRWAIDARVVHRAETLRTAIQDASAVYVPERLHAVRIAAKKLRYAMELRSEAAGDRKRSADLRALKLCQELLGRQHDRQVLIERVRQIQASLTAPELEVGRRLDALQTALETECRRLHARFVRDAAALVALCDRASGLRQSRSTARSWRPASTTAASSRRAG